MSLEPGTRLGPYELIALIGAGGMGAVYRARDVRLGRTVAVKVLTGASASDTAASQRFRREARAISSLSHPKVCALYDVGNHEGIDYLVMELIEGPTLRERLAKGQMPLADVLRYGSEIASALDAAHKAGIVHRDLKPGNVMLTKAGVKLLDFGLARPVQGRRQPDGTVIEGPEITQPGTVMGTIHYMAPEQLEGREADARSDVFAFGAVLFEMATGRKAFEGTSTASVIAAILSGKIPRFPDDRTDLPPVLGKLVTACLIHDPDERWQSLADVARLLTQLGAPNAVHAAAAVAATAAAAAGPAPAPASPAELAGLRSPVVAWTVTAVLAVALGAALSAAFRPAPAPPTYSFRLEPPEGTSFHSVPRVSPDGRAIAFCTRDDRQATRLWVRALDSVEPWSYPDSEGCQQVCWSPDGAWVAFATTNEIKRIRVSDGTVQKVCPSERPRTMAWSPSGDIVYGATGMGLYKVRASGGTPSPLVTPDRAAGEFWASAPVILPGGGRFLYLTGGRDMGKAGTVWTGTLENPRKGKVTTADGLVGFVPPRWLLLMAGTTLRAVPFDADEGQLRGSPVDLVHEVGLERLAELEAKASVSTGGLLAYRSEAGEFSVVDEVSRTGRRTSTLISGGHLRGVTASSDGRFVAYERVNPLTAILDIWLLDVARGVKTELTYGTTVGSRPRFSREGRKILYQVARENRNALFVREASSSSQDHELMVIPLESLLTDWSPDGRHVLLAALLPDRRIQLQLLEVGSQAPPVPYETSTPETYDGRISPDGLLVAFVGGSPGRDGEVFVGTLPPAGKSTQVSVGGGRRPRWRADGQELFYESLEGTVMAVAVTRSDDGLAFGKPEPLFRSREGGFEPLAPDGTTFLVASRGEGRSAPSLSVVTDFRRLLPR